MKNDADDKHKMTTKTKGVDPKTVVYSVDSMRFSDDLRRDLGQKIRRLAAEHAATQGRDIVVEEDVRAVFRAALLGMAESMGAPESSN